jgi:hypothetical protein
MALDWTAAILIIGGLFFFSYFLRFRIATLLQRIPLPVFFVFVLSSIPFILLEENVNCLASGCQFIPSTLPILLLFVVALGMLVHVLKLKDFVPALLLFMVWGYFVEVFVFHFDPAYFARPLIELVVGAMWLMASYAVLVIIPLTYLQLCIAKK